MHIHEGVLAPEILVAGACVAAAGIAIGLRRMPTEQVMPTALLAAGFFVASFIHFSIGAVNIHLTLNALLGMLLGWAAFPAMFAALLLQAVLFGYGGITVLGVNTVVMALPAVGCGMAARRLQQGSRQLASLTVAALVTLTLLASNALYVLALAASGTEFLPIAKIAFLASLPLIAIESAITCLALRTIYRIKPDVFLPHEGS